MALIKKSTKENNELSNLSNNDQISNKAVVLSGKLIPIIRRNLLSKLGSSYFLDVLPPDSDSKTVCDHIHLLLLLNQLQHLIIETILDHTIKNKGNMFFYIN